MSDHEIMRRLQEHRRNVQAAIRGVRRQLWLTHKILRALRVPEGGGT